MNATPATCAWCGVEIAQSGRGRPRKFCRASCRQRAYTQRNNVSLSGSTISPDSVIMQPDRYQLLKDELFELRCAAEDIATASSEGASAGEIRDLCDELVHLAKRIEKLR
nr:hypothetical protein [Corynebacterium maris]